MFIVSRKSEESVIVDGFNNPKREIKITVLEVKNGRVELSLEVNAEARFDHPRSELKLHDGNGSRVPWSPQTTRRTDPVTLRPSSASSLPSAEL